MRFSEHDRVRLEGMRLVGTVSNQWTKVQGESQVGVQWDSGTFAFVSTDRLVPDSAGLTPDEHVAIGQAFRRAVDATAERLDHNCSAGGTDVVEECQNRTESGTDVTDWQARAERAEDRLREMQTSCGERHANIALSLERAEAQVKRIRAHAHRLANNVGGADNSYIAARINEALDGDAR